jgi:hypothetical protein
MEGLEARINNPSMQACTPPMITEARLSGDHTQSYQTSVIDLASPRLWRLRTVLCGSLAETEHGCVCTFVHVVEFLRVHSHVLSAVMLVLSKIVWAV